MKNNTNYTFKHNPKIDYVKLKNDIDKNDKIAYLIYRLLVDSEFNAMVAESYGDFKNKLFDRQKYQHEIKNTECYHERELLKGILNELNACDGWEQHAMTYFNKKMTIDAFRNWFIEKIQDRLTEYWRRIGLVASLYYDDLERNDNNF